MKNTVMVAARGVLFAGLFVGFGAAAGAADADLALHYDRPGIDWEHEGLPIGNGAMGAMILGGVATDTVQFNEKTLWTGGPGSVQGYDFGLPAGSLKAKVAAVQDELNAKTRLAPEYVAKILGRAPVGFGAYQNFGAIVLTRLGAPIPYGDYRRSLDIARAVAQVHYTANGVHFTRSYFASYPDKVIVIHLTADKPRQISFKVALAIPKNRTLTLLRHAGRLTTRGRLYDNALEYEAQLQVEAKGGVRKGGPDGSVIVQGADSATLILGAGTNYALHYPDYRGADPHPALQARMNAADAKSYNRLLADHEADYRALFGRVTFDIGQVMPAMATDQLLMQYKARPTPADRALEALFFQYGRYLLIASSRAGSLPANLQGVWNDSDAPPWNADYHVNINLEMNYWPAEVTNLAETEAPLFAFIDALIPPGRKAAERLFGAPGWVMNLGTNAWGYTGLIAWPTAFWQPEGAAWLTRQYDEHYRFSLDDKFLVTRAYPAMKAAAQFWLAVLVTDPRDGKLVVSPSYSPEHGPFSAGASISQQIVFDLFTSVSEAAHHLRDTAFAARIDAALARLDPGLRIGSWGQLQEWKGDWDDPSDEHRHVSHLFALDPGHQLLPRTMPRLAQAARVTLHARGDGGTGWSKAWKISFWARLLDGDHAYKMLGEQLRESTLPNLLDTCPPFQIDGNFGATTGIAQMLLQSQDGGIDILPALPGNWPQGRVKGLRARGDVTVAIAWSKGEADKVVLWTGHGGPLVLRSDIFAGAYAVTDAAGRAVATTHSKNGIVIQTQSGEKYTLQRLSKNTQKI